MWLYFRFCLSFRDVEELLLERGVVVTYEAIRKWCRKFGQQYANQLRRRRPRPGDKWHLDEVFLTIKGEHHYLWRAVDQDGNVLDILVQRRRDKQAAKKFFRKLLKGFIVRAAGDRHRQTEELRQPLSERSFRGWNIASTGISTIVRRTPINPRATRRHMQRFKSPGHAQRFLSAYGPIPNTSVRAGIAFPRPPIVRRCREIPELAGDHDPALAA